MAATVHRLRTRSPRRTEHLQGTLELGGWSEPVRLELNERLSNLALHALPGWNYAMIAVGTINMGAFLRTIQEGPRALSTLAVWMALLTCVRIDTGEVIAGQRKIAEIANVDLRNTNKALKRLVEIGALLDDGRGHYRIHPTFAWKGDLAKRAAAEARAPKLQLAE